MGGNHAREDAREQDYIDHNDRGKRHVPNIRPDRHHNQRDEAPEAKHRKFAEAVASLAHERAHKNSTDAGHKVDHGQNREGQSDVIHDIGRAEGHQHVAAGRQQRQKEERQAIARLGDGMNEMHQRAALLLQREVPDDRLH